MGGRVRCSKVRAENLSESNEEEMEIGDVPALVKWHMSTTVTPKERKQDFTDHNLVETIPMALLFGGRAFSEERKTFTKRP